MSADPQIIGKNIWFQVQVADRVLPQRFTSYGNAVAALPGITARLRPMTITPCLCCRAQFKSTGPANRLCPSCRRDA
jgi:hypothetical protein